ncbi:cation:proton antiporter regulatory subunit [Nocardioides sp. GCM10027113]|uniref:cation:proton antiporter regulatory subunit n=1 Tax=unclassified Nocardioides TaxID=2615069 RepID=UPI00360AAAAB
MDINEVMLPGVGLRYEFSNADGDHLGIVARRTGDFELVRYPPDDPDEARPLFRLSAEEAGAVAEILGAPRIVERFADLTREVPGLSAAQLEVPEHSPHVGEPLGHTRARTLTGASIVAIVRGEEVIASPRPSEPLAAGDTLIVIGTAGGITKVREILNG